MKVAVLGAGSIGGYLGGYLHSAGCDVTLIGRRRIKWDVDMRGLILSHYKREPIAIAQEDIEYSLKYDSLGEADVILVCVKSQDSAAVGGIIQEYADKNSLIISFQNGINNQGKIERICTGRVLGGIVPFNVTRVRVGTFHSGTEGDLIIENDSDPRLEKLSAAFKKSGMGVKLEDDIINLQWGKLLVNLNNALSALSGGTLREGLDQKEYREVLAAMMEEALNICKIGGIEPKTFGKASISKTISILRMPNVLFGPIMNSILKIDKSARSSMLDDLDNGKATEVDYLQGEVVRLAESHGRKAPINEIVMTAVQFAFEKGKSPYMSGADMKYLIEKV